MRISFKILKAPAQLRMRLPMPCGSPY